jgi:hypothetical protein
MWPLDPYGVKQFSEDYPGMRITPSRGSSMIMRGVFSFTAAPEGGQKISDHYQIEIEVPDAFPHALPTVKETGRRIPRDRKHHVNDDGTLCLGSPLRLLHLISIKPNLTGFAENCLVPYFYALTNKLNNGGNFLFGELDHGEKGIVDDFKDLFGLQTRTQVNAALKLLAMRRRVANKNNCPCGCGRRLGKCPIHRKLNVFRKLVPRSWFSKVRQ